MTNSLLVNSMNEFQQLVAVGSGSTKDIVKFMINLLIYSKKKSNSNFENQTQFWVTQIGTSDQLKPINLLLAPNFILFFFKNLNSNSHIDGYKIHPILVLGSIPFYLYMELNPRTKIQFQVLKEKNLNSSFDSISKN